MFGRATCYSVAVGFLLITSTLQPHKVIASGVSIPSIQIDTSPYKILSSVNDFFSGLGTIIKCTTTSCHKRVVTLVNLTGDTFIADGCGFGNHTVPDFKYKISDSYGSSCKLSVKPKITQGRNNIHASVNINPKHESITHDRSGIYQLVNAGFQKKCQKPTFFSPTSCAYIGVLAIVKKKTVSKLSNQNVSETLTRGDFERIFLANQLLDLFTFHTVLSKKQRDTLYDFINLLNSMSTDANGRSNPSSSDEIKAQLKPEVEQLLMMLGVGKGVYRLPAQEIFSPLEATFDKFGDITYAKNRLIKNQNVYDPSLRGIILKFGFEYISTLHLLIEALNIDRKTLYSESHFRSLDQFVNFFIQYNKRLPAQTAGKTSGLVEKSTMLFGIKYILADISTKYGSAQLDALMFMPIEDDNVVIKELNEIRRGYK